MLIRVYASSGGRASSVAEVDVDALRLMIMAEPREEEARQRGRAWTAGAVPFFAQQLIIAAQTHQSRDIIERQAANAALAAWLCDSIYDGVTAEAFVESDLVFTLLRGGAVKYDRIPADLAGSSNATANRD